MEKVYFFSNSMRRKPPLTHKTSRRASLVPMTTTLSVWNSNGHWRNVRHFLVDSKCVTAAIISVALTIPRTGEDLRRKRCSRKEGFEKRIRSISSLLADDLSCVQLSKKTRSTERKRGISTAVLEYKQKRSVWQSGGLPKSFVQSSPSYCISTYGPPCPILSSIIYCRSSSYPSRTVHDYPDHYGHHHHNPPSLHLSTVVVMSRREELSSKPRCRIRAIRSRRSKRSQLTGR